MSGLVSTMGSSYVSAAIQIAWIFFAWKTLCFFASVWVFFVARDLPQGPKRALACLPAVVALLGATPYLVDRCFMPLMVVPLTTMLSVSAFKVAAFALGRGPLALQTSEWFNSFPKFGAVMTLPIIPTAALTPRRSGRSIYKHKHHSKDGGTDSCISSITVVTTAVPTSPTTFPAFLQALSWQIAFLALSAYCARQFWLPASVRHWFYALLLALELEWVWNWYGFVAAACFGIEPARSFDAPWKSASLAEYWARRWNLPATHMLRVLIYDPIIEGRLVAAPQPEAAAAAAAATKMASAAAAASGRLAGRLADLSAVSDIYRTSSNDSSTSRGSAASSTSDSAAGQVTSSSKGAASDAVGWKAANNSFQEPSFKEWQLASEGAAVAMVTATASGAAGDTSKPSFAAYRGGAGARKPSVLKRFLGVQASFAFSGIWHTLIFYYATGQWIPHWFAFFAVQAPALVLETAFMKWTKAHKLRLPHAAAVLLTNCGILVFGSPLFCMPCDRSGFAQAMFDSVTGQLASSEWQRLCRA